MWDSAWFHSVQKTFIGQQYKNIAQVSQVVIDWNCMSKRDFIEFTRFARKEISQIFLKSYKRYLYNLSKFVRFLAVGD